MSLVKLINFTPLGDERGSLVALESNKIIPFDIKRVYYIFGTKDGVSRGFHAHKTLKQVLVCVSGKCRITLDNGLERKDVWLDSSLKGLVVEDFIWREMHDFSEDCVLMVLANQHYNENDYIRSYSEFLRKCKYV